MSKPRPIKRIGRKRRAAGWTLLTLGLLVAGVWAWSGFRQVRANGSPSAGWYVRVRQGVVRIYVPTGKSERDRSDARMLDIMVDLIDSGTSRWELWPQNVGFSTKVRDSWSVAAPVWPIPLLLWTPAALLLRSGIRARRRAITNACPKCGYSLAGLAAGAPCPECGKRSAPQ